MSNILHHTPGIYYMASQCTPFMNNILSINTDNNK